MVGSTKIENQTNISNDVEAIAKAVIDAYLKGKENKTNDSKTTHNILSLPIKGLAVGQAFR